MSKAVVETMGPISSWSLPVTFEVCPEILCINRLK